MTDDELVSFLQWALPKIGFRWKGFKKVRRQIGKRLKLRLSELDLYDIGAYKELLQTAPAEWGVFKSFCNITISRFYRDKAVFKTIQENVFPDLIKLAKKTDKQHLNFWSIGCCSGEEPYTIAILWDEYLISDLNDQISPEILATDISPALIQRAQNAIYTTSGVRDLPNHLINRSFKVDNRQYVLKDRYKKNIDFQIQDICTTIPKDKFNIILCRNLIFTYFDYTIQKRLLNKILKNLVDGGFLVIGIHEKLPPGEFLLQQIEGINCIFRKVRN